MTSPGLRCGAPERAVVVVGLLCPPQSLLGGVDAAGLQAVVIGHVARKPHEYKGRSGTYLCSFTVINGGTYMSLCDIIMVVCKQSKNMHI